MSKKRILIADDHSAIRSGVKHILSLAYSDVEFGEAADTVEVVRQIQTNPWDLIILDIDFKGRSGLDVLSYMRKEGVTVPVLVFTFHREDQVALMAFKSGASGYLTKDATDEELIDAIEHLLSGRKYIPQSISETLVGHLQKPSGEAPHQLLSPREFEILLLIAKGRSVAEIAEELNLSISTVHTYRARMLEKMEVRNNAQLTNYVFKHNLI